MSGGSWDYLYCKMQDAADELMQDTDPLRRAFGKKMEFFAQAMHDIEWADSGDRAKGSEHKAIENALGKGTKELVMSELIEEARELKQKLEKYGA